MKRYLLFLVFLVLNIISIGQNSYMAYFIDKKDTAFDPIEFFDAKAIVRRVKINYSLNHFTDLPVRNDFIEALKKNVDSLGYVSRWLNAANVIASANQVAVIQEFPFIKKLVLITNDFSLDPCSYKTDLDIEESELLKKQIEHLEGDYFIDNNIDGKGIRIAVFDGGFPSVNSNPAFKSLFKNEQIIKTWDFVRNKENVYDYISHGTMVLSCIAGKIDSVNIGLATGAEFLLARTEVKSEPFSEELNWLAAAEWADKNGADIINSSLGYTFNRYFPTEMDGTSFVSKAATMAASKGILVVNSMGNDGADDWKYVGAPADADSVLSVGAIDSHTGFHTNFSSFGPTSDKRLKPNVVALGDVISAGKSGLKGSQGTSFSSPLIAGFAACVWQMHPELNNMEIYDEICKSASLYPYYDYAHGYGVPKARYFSTKDDTIKPSFRIEESSNTIAVRVFETGVKDEFGWDEYLYYHIENKGVIDKYAVIRVYKNEALVIQKDLLEEGSKLMIHYLGFTEYYINK